MTYWLTKSRQNVKFLVRLRSLHQHYVLDEEQSTDDSIAVEIDFDLTVTHWETSFAITCSSGSALGLWLGVSVIQISKEIEKIVTKVKDKIRS